MHLTALPQQKHRLHQICRKTVPFLQKTTNCVFGDGALTLKIHGPQKRPVLRSSSTAGTELVPAALCRRTRTSVKTSKEMGVTETLLNALPHLHYLPRFSESRVHLLTVTRPQDCSGSSVSEALRTPLKMKGAGAAWLHGEPASTVQESKGGFA